jgi:hypothetical protein
LSDINRTWSAGVLRLGPCQDPGFDAVGRIDSDSYDAVVCTLLLQYAYDLDWAIREICVADEAFRCSPSRPAWSDNQSRRDENDFWRFTALSARKLFETYFQPRSVEIERWAAF